MKPEWAAPSPEFNTDASVKNLLTMTLTAAPGSLETPWAIGGEGSRQH